LAKIVSIATTENQMALAENVKVLSCRALETLTRDIRTSELNSETQDPQNQDGLQMPLIAPNFVHVSNSREQSESAYDKSGKEEFAPPAKMIELKFSAKNLKNLLELQNKGIDINEIIEEALDKREAEIARAKKENSQKLKTTDSRYIPATIRHILDAEQGDKCSAPNCNNPAQIIHHELPFTITKIHDPNNLQKLCKAHHELKHSINIKFYTMKKRAINSS